MAFSLGSSNPSTAELGPDLPDVFAEEVGFKGVSGDSNVQFLPSPWPAEALPAPTCTLLAVASTKGVVVGAGPYSLSISSSEAVRKAISASTGEGKVKTKPFQAQATISLPARPTHVAFASSDDALLLASEAGPQLSVFQTTSLFQPNPQPILSIPTNGATFRTVAPNPAPAAESHGAYVALVTTGGALLIADLKAGNLLSGPNGSILKTGVSSVCWSNKGKQLVAGLQDGSSSQMTPDGTEKAVIPPPPDITDPYHVSSISWLENDIFLMVYTPNTAEDDMGLTPSSLYYIVSRRKDAPFLFQKLPEVSSPFGFKRAPAYQFIARLRDYQPHLKDALIVSSTASADVGLFTRSDQPLASEDSAKATVGLFVMTEVSDDSKRAGVPLNENSGDETSVIGLGMDLSSTESVISPIQGEDIAESSTPLPNLLLLNHEGILCSWWFIYNESIRQKIPYPGLAAIAPQSQLTPQQQSEPPKQPVFGQSSFGASNPVGQSAFGASPFGKPSGPATFGNPSALGAGQPSVFGKPSFGSTSLLGQGNPKFGQSSFGSTAPFGQPSTTPTKPLPFGAASTTSGSGFGSFANTGGFAGLASSNPSGGTPFGKPTSDSPFSNLSGPSAFGAQSNNNPAFTTQNMDQSKGLFRLNSGEFNVGSTFKGDGTAVNDGPKPEKPGGLFSLGGSFEDMVSTPNKGSPPTESMDDMEETPAPQLEVHKTKAPGLPLFGAPSGISASTSSSIFGSLGAQPQSQPPFTSTLPNKSPFSMLGNTATEKQSLTPSSPPSEKTAIASPPLTQARLPDPVTTPITSIPEPPLPPDSTSKIIYGPGDTSASSNVSKSSVEDAPLPPDFSVNRIPSEELEGEPPLPPDFTTLAPNETVQEAEEAPLPPDFTTQKLQISSTAQPGPIPNGSDADESEEDIDEGDESDFGDSGEDITHEIEKPQASTHSLKTSPESSFSAEISEKSPSGGLFGRVSQPTQASRQQSRQLFGEISKPFFPQAPQNRELPRSPSPVRPVRIEKSVHKLDGHKPASAAHRPGSALAARKVSLSEVVRRESQLRTELGPPLQEQRSQPSSQTQNEPLSLSDDDEDERLRSDLARPLEPVPTLDPFLPHQDYTGETTKPGIPGQIERLYRDINSMVDTLGINARSLSSFILYQQSSANPNWINILQSDHPSNILDEKLLLREIGELDTAVTLLTGSLEQQRVQKVEEKLENCRELLGKDILSLRKQCASVQKTLDAYTDTGAILSAPLSAEQANLQQDLRSSSAQIQAKLADLESAVSLLRAKLSDVSRSDGSRQSMKRPTVEAVTSTIATMMNMVESKSSDIDVLEVQLKKLGIDTSAPASSREGSPFATPSKALGRYPSTPGSRGSMDGLPSLYHTPDSTTRGVNFRTSLNGSAKASRLRTMESMGGSMVSKQESTQWKDKVQRKQQILTSLKKAIGEKKSKIRSLDDM